MNIYGKIGTPLDARVKQELLEMAGAGRRLERLHALLVKQGSTA